MTPTIFVNNKRLSLWTGVIGLDSLYLMEFYQTIGKKRHDVFPIVFYVDPKLQSGMQMNIPDTSDPPIPGITSPMYSGNSLTHLFRESSDPGIPGMV